MPLRFRSIGLPTDYKLEKGVVLTVPRNTSHWVRETQPGFRFFVVRSVAQD